MMIACGAALLSLCSMSAVGLSPEDVIDTIAGGGLGDGYPSQVASVEPQQVSVGPDGSVYIAETERHRVRRIDGVTGIIETIAGLGGGGFSGDGGLATSARLRYPTGAAADAFGNVYICDQSNHRIRKIDANGIITTVAGSGQSGYADGAALSAKFYYPRSIAIDSAGNVLIADPFNYRIRRLNVAAQQVVTIAGNGAGGYNGDDIAALQARLNFPTGVWGRPDGSFLIADSGNHRVRVVNAQGSIDTLAGTGVAGFSGDGGSATSAKLFNPVAVSANPQGEVLIADQSNHRIRIVRTNHNIYTVAGTGTAGYNGDEIPATSAQLSRPSSVSPMPSGNCVLADLDNLRVRYVDGCNGAIHTLAGISSSFTGDGWPAQVAQFGAPTSVARDSLGNIYIADSTSHRVRRIDPQGIISTLAGTGTAGFSGDGGAANQAKLSLPFGVAVDAQRNVFIVDTGNRRVRKVNASDGRINTVVGNGQSGSGGDGGSALNASLQYPLGLAVDGANNLYIADAAGRRVRKVNASGIIQTIAGTGIATWTIDGEGGNSSDNLGDGGLAVNATLISPRGITVDGSGNVYIVDDLSHRVRAIDTAGRIRTAVGNGVRTNSVDGPGGNPIDNLGDGGPANQATLNGPVGATLTAENDLVIADQINHRIRVVSDGYIHTISGGDYATWAVDGEGGFPSDDLGDQGAVIDATLVSPSSVLSDSAGNLFVADSESTRLREVFSSGIPPTASFTQTPTPPPPTATPPPPTATQPPATATRTFTPTNAPNPPTNTPTRTNTPLPTSTTSVLGVAGRVVYYKDDRAVPNVQVTFSGPISTETETTNSGDYSLMGVSQGTWSVEPEKLGELNDGISSLDAAYALQASTRTRLLSDEQRLACDVTGNGSVSALDAARILQLVVGILPRFEVAQTCGSDWLFVPSPEQVANQYLIDPSIDTDDCSLGRISLSPLTTAVDDQDFTAILFGDCTGNWRSDSGGARQAIAAGADSVRLGPPRHGHDGSLLLPLYVRSSRPFSAIEIDLGYDPSTLEIRGASARKGSGSVVKHHAARPGTVRIALASPAPIEPGHGAVLFVEVGAQGGLTALPQILGALVDERPASAR